MIRHGVETLRWLWTAFTQPQPAELAALPQPEARADRIALHGVALVNVVVLLLALASARPHAPPRSAPAAAPVSGHQAA